MARICGELGHGWAAVDVDTDPELRAEYGDRVPVIMIDGREHGFWRVEEAAVPRRAGRADAARPMTRDRVRHRLGRLVDEPSRARDANMRVSATAPPRAARPPAPDPARPSPLIGLLAVGAALGAGHLVAGLVSPASSPFLAVGDAVIRLSPQLAHRVRQERRSAPPTSRCCSTGMAVVHRRRGRGGRAGRRGAGRGRAVGVVAVLGRARAAAAVMLAPVFAPLDLLAPAAALVAGRRRCSGWLHRLALAAPSRPSPGASRPRAGRADVPARRAGRLVRRGRAWLSLAAGGGGLLLGARRRGLARRRSTARLAPPGCAERAPAIPAAARVPRVRHPDVHHVQRRTSTGSTPRCAIPALSADGLAAAHPRHGRPRAHADASTTCWPGRSSSARSR